MLFICKDGLGALYARDEDRLLSPFIFTALPDMPKFGEEHIWTLHIGDHPVLFDAKERVSVLMV
jgi:hypothetical protein